MGWDIFSIGGGIALGVGIGIVWWILIKSFTEPYYHKYLLLGSNTIVKCDISNGVFQCKNSGQIFNPSIDSGTSNKEEES